MATRRAQQPPDPVLKIFASHEEIHRGIVKIERRLQDVRGLQVEGVRHGDQRVNNVEAAISKTVLEVFGSASSEYQRHRHYRIVSSWPMNAPDQEYQRNFEEAIPGTLTMLQGMIDSLRESALDLESPSAPELMQRATDGDGIFLVHGRNEDWLREVELLLKNLLLQPKILRKEPNCGQTLIEKFELHAAGIGFAVVLLTGDDEGRLQPITGGNAAEASFVKRARQNVILELGFFLGRLGRSKVCALYEEGVEIPSDYSGVVFIPLKSGWKAALVKELQAAGIKFDPADAIVHI